MSAGAHIGSPGVVMQGKAGPYPVLVNIMPPDVIPGVAKVTVIAQESEISAVTARTIYFRTGDEGAPDPENLLPVPGMPGQFTADVWMMASGSGSVQLEVSGKLGKGQMVVPVLAVSTAVRQMPASTTWTLLGLGGFLFILMVTIIGSAVSDALTKRGEDIPRHRRRNRVIGLATGALFSSLALYGGKAWWDSWADDYQKYMFRPMQASSLVHKKDSTVSLEFVIDTTKAPRASSLSYLVPDHGKMMHMFVLRIPEMDAFAHLHPQRLDSARFHTLLPPLPKGKYLVYADIVYYSGFTETIRDTFDLAEDIAAQAAKTDPEDAYVFALPANLADNAAIADKENLIVCGQPGIGARLKDGTTMVWEGMQDGPLKADQLYQMTFSVIDAKQQPVQLDPYIGMTGHAAIIRNDGNVYMHLHPVGTFSMAASNNLQRRIEDTVASYRPPDRKYFRDSIDQYLAFLKSLPDAGREALLMSGADMDNMQMDSAGNMKHPNMVEFPYSFPSPGQYRIWVQVKHKGQVLTAAFDKMVE